MKKKVLNYLIISISIVGIFGIAWGTNALRNQFNTRYGTAGTVLDQCILCHTTNTNVGPLNSYGDTLALNNNNFAAVESIDSDGDGFSNIAEITARTFPGNAASRPATADTTPPTVTAFTIPASSSSLTVPITTFTATDNVRVTGYMVTESSTPPSASAPGWSATAPASYVFSTAGTKTLYAWAKDAAGNVSASRSASVTITLTTGSAVDLFDYDGDGKTDMAIYRANTGAWYILPSGGSSPNGMGWGGAPTDKPVVGDFNGDGKTDLAIYRSSTGAWYIYPTGGGSPYGVGWGGDPNDKPVPGDYDGDGKMDLAIYRSNIGAWYILPSSGASPYRPAAHHGRQAISACRFAHSPLH
ncbi:MAG: VCBS repeat-containing protein, partial [Treponemataceae bacterium]|nr:VCBS repeat-containing protein [Treponemataceae bacterium]